MRINRMMATSSILGLVVTAGLACWLTFLLTGTTFWGSLGLSAHVHSSPVDW